MTVEQQLNRAERRAAGYGAVTLSAPLLGHEPALEQMADAAGLTGRQRRVWLLTIGTNLTDAEIGKQVGLRDVRRVSDTLTAANRKVHEKFGAEWKDSGGKSFLIRCIRNKADHGDIPDNLHDPLPDAEWPRLPSEQRDGQAAKPWGMVPSDLTEARTPMRNLLETVCSLTGTAVPRLVVRVSEAPPKRTGEAEYQRKIAELRAKGGKLATAKA